MKWFRRKSKTPRCCHPDARQHLSDCSAAEEGVVLSNTDHRTTEMGFTHGTPFQVIRNDDGDDSLIAVVGESRFAVPRTAAAQIVVCVGAERHKHRRRRRGHRQCCAT